LGQAGKHVVISNETRPGPVRLVIAGIAASFRNTRCSISL
jgi:hypothetical protein